MRTNRIAMACALALAVVAGRSVGQSPTSVPSDADTDSPTGDLTAGGKVASPIFPGQLPAQPTPELDPLIKPDPLDPVFRPWYALKKTLNDNYGLKIDGAYTFHNQYVTRSLESRNDELGGRLDFGVNWTMLHYGEQNKDVGQLIVLLRSSENIGMRQDYAVSDAAGSTLGTNSLHGGGDQIPVSLNLLYWRSTFFDQKLAVSVGKIHPNSWIDLSPVANDETKQFMSGAYTGNLADPGQGLWTPGVAFEYNFDANWYFHFVVANSLGRTGTSGLDAWNFYEAAEVGYKTGDAVELPGNYRVTAWHNESGNGDGWGMSVGFDQEIGGGWAPFARVGHSEKDAAYVTDFVSVGIANLRPFGRRGDMFGLAGTYGKPSNTDVREEQIYETFYRIKLTDSLEFSPDVQWVNHPANQPDVDNLFVLGARLKVLF